MFILGHPTRPNGDGSSMGSRWTTGAAGAVEEEDNG